MAKLETGRKRIFDQQREWEHCTYRAYRGAQLFMLFAFMAGVTVVIWTIPEVSVGICCGVTVTSMLLLILTIAVTPGPREWGLARAEVVSN